MFRRDPKYLGELRAAFAAAQVTVVNIAVDGKHSIYGADAAERDRAIAESKSWIDVAVAIGSSSVRTHVGRKPKIPVRTWSARRKACGMLRNTARQNNVVVNLENDDPVSEDGFFIGKLVATVKVTVAARAARFCQQSGGNGRASRLTTLLDGMFSEAYNICHVKALEVNEIGEKFQVNMGRSFQNL